ncbi:MAG: hypothetical protein IMZ60_02785, partial [Actinobacteria bacterium]|nr:hypothetical protein [Actinomycetota bacterium]
MTYKNLFLIVIIGILFVNLASALQIEDSLDKLYEKGSINPFGNKKLVYEPITEDKINSNNFMLSETSADYPIIRLSKSIFWIANDKIAEYKLTSVTSSIINAEATGKAILYQKGKLFDDVDFYDKLGNEKEIYYKYFILKNESYEEEIIDWKQDCS